MISGIWKSITEGEKQVWRDRADRERALHKLKYPEYKFEPRPSSEINRRNKKLAKRAGERDSSPSTIGEDVDGAFEAADSPEGGAISQSSISNSNLEFNFNTPPELPIGYQDAQHQFGHKQEEENSPAVFGIGASPEDQFGYEPLDYEQEDFSMFTGAQIEQNEEYGYGQEGSSKLDEPGYSQQEEHIESDEEFYSRLFKMGDEQ